MEILAPAGSIEALKAAVYSHADAVYLGVDKLNARLKADNFTTQNLSFWVEFCHVYGVKVYLTINTLIKDNEIDIAKQIIECAREAKVDAFIIADIAVYELCKQYAPNIALHASTQMGIHNLLGAKFIERLGFKRVVLSREARLDEIKSIKANTKLEIEYFVHGALCVCFSGGCLFSSIASGNSGNRGKCLQLCRKEYANSLNDKIGYFMSPKDQCLIDNLDELKSCGVDCIKIEGRMRSPEYVSTTVENYRKKINGKQLTSHDKYALSAVFNRGNFTSGYSFDKTKEIMFPNIQGHYGASVGKIISSIKDGNFHLITIKLLHDIPAKFGAKIIFNDTELGGGEVNVINYKGDIAQFLWQTNLQVGASIHVTSDSTIKSMSPYKIKIEVHYRAIQNKSLSITVKCGSIEIEKSSEFICQEAKSQAISHEQIAKQLAKTGDTYFEISNIEGQFDNNIFIPNGVLSDIRREILSLLEREIISRYNNENIANFSPVIMPKTLPIEGSLIEVMTLPKILDEKYSYILNYSNNLESIMKNALIHNNLYIKLPKIALESDCAAIIKILSALPNNVGIYADNYYSVQLALEVNRPIIYGFGLNIFNSIAAKFYNKCYCLSPELSAKECLSLNGYVYCYGYLPVMTFAHCPYQVVTQNKCSECKYVDFEYLDKYGSYKVNRTKVINCQFTLDNGVCHNIIDNKLKLKYYDLRRLSVLEIENFAKCGTLTPNEKCTMGHHIRGVE